MTDRIIHRATPESINEKTVGAAGVVAGLTALLSAAACCVLPLGLAAAGLGAGSLAVLVPFHWPLTITALVIVAAGWALCLRNARACASEACEVSRRSTASLVLLGLATAAVLLSVAWGFIEQPLMRTLGGA